MLVPVVRLPRALARAPRSPIADPLWLGGLVHDALHDLYAEAPGDDAIPRAGDVERWNARFNEICSTSLPRRGPTRLQRRGSPTEHRPHHAFRSRRSWRRRPSRRPICARAPISSSEASAFPTRRATPARSTSATSRCAGGSTASTSRPDGQSRGRPRLQDLASGLRAGQVRQGAASSSCRSTCSSRATS